MAAYRRSPGVFDPFVVMKEGEEALRARLMQLDVEHLKDIVAEHAMDSTKLAMKWKTPERLVELIISTVRGRLAKGAVSPSVTRNRRDIRRRARTPGVRRIFARL